MYHKGILKKPSIPCHSTLPIWSKTNSTAATSDHQWGAGFPPVGLCIYTVSTLASSRLAEFLKFYFLCSEQLLLFITIQWRRQWHPTPVLLLGKSHGWRSLVGCGPWARYESDTTERLHFQFSLSCIGEGNGNPFQCSCLENPRNRGAWWAAIYGVTQSQIQLTWLSSSSIIIQWPVKTIARKHMWFSKPSTSTSYPQMKCGLCRWQEDFLWS